MKKTLTMTLMVAGLLLAGGTSAFAADDMTCDTTADTPCAVTLSSSGDVDIQPTDETTVSPEDAVGSCWVNEDGSEQCAKTGVISEDLTGDGLPEIACDTTDGEFCLMANTGMVRDLAQPTNAPSSNYVLALTLIASALGALIYGINSRYNVK